MKCTVKLCGFAITILLWQCTLASAAQLTVNFDPGGTPDTPLGPSTFSTAGPTQTITVPNQVTITGGVVLGNPTNLPAITFATPPNVYATAVTDESGGVTADPSLLRTITITIDPSFNVTEVGGVLINGLQTLASYVVTAFNSATEVDSNTLLDVPSNTSLGFGLFDVSNNPITSVTIAPVNLEGTWDYFVDTLTFNHPVPEPSSLLLAVVGFVGLIASAWRRRRRVLGNASL